MIRDVFMINCFYLNTVLDFNFVEIPIEHDSGITSITYDSADDWSIFSLIVINILSLFDYLFFSSLKLVNYYTHYATVIYEFILKIIDWVYSFIEQFKHFKKTIVYMHFLIIYAFLCLPQFFLTKKINWRFFILNTMLLIKKIKNFLTLKVVVQIHWFLMLLFILLTYNIISLIPRIMSFTIILIIPTFCSLWFFSVVNFLGLHSRCDDFILKFYPIKLPPLISPAIIWIELISYLMRPVSLAARLFANMIAGHILVHIISGYAQTFFVNNFFVLTLSTMLLLSILNFMEYFVAMVQSFLFIFIGALYYKDNL